MIACMKHRLAALSLTALALAVPTVAHAQLELKNDGFVSGQSAGFQGGFHDAEIGASRFVGPGPRQLLGVRLLFGGSGGTRTVTLHVWDDSAGTTAPGGEVFSGDFQLTGSNDQMHEIDVSGMNVFVPAQFRVGIEMQGNPGVDLGYPSLARDADGSIAADKNYLLADIAGTFMWFRSQALGLTGDWIIRAVVADGGGTPDAGVVDAPMGGPDANTGGPDAGGGGSCNGNGDCALGSYCDTNVHACTFDCREDQDCGGGDMACNSLGQCIAADGSEGGGCCSTGGDGALGALGLAGMVGLLVTRRRRRTA